MALKGLIALASVMFIVCVYFLVIFKIDFNFSDFEYEIPLIEIYGHEKHFCTKHYKMYIRFYFMPYISTIGRKMRSIFSVN